CGRTSAGRSAGCAPGTLRIARKPAQIVQWPTADALAVTRRRPADAIVSLAVGGLDREDRVKEGDLDLVRVAPGPLRPRLGQLFLDRSLQHVDVVAGHGASLSGYVRRVGRPAARSGARQRE